MPTFVPSRNLELLKTRINYSKGALKEPELISLYTSLRNFESDYDAAQSALRGIASAWLLASVAGVAFVLHSQYAASPPLQPSVAHLLIQVINLVSTVGYIMLWYLDQGVYQRLLNSIFAAGCWLEDTHSDKIPPVRIYAYGRNDDVTKYMSVFYVSPLALYIFSTFVLLFYIERKGTHVEVIISMIIIQVIILGLALIFASRWPSIEPELPKVAIAS